ncbi:MAG: hypothetical protein ABIB47_06355, partial [Candidatus Woesearchaeota archaeon]
RRRLFLMLFNRYLGFMERIINLPEYLNNFCDDYLNKVKKREYDYRPDLEAIKNFIKGLPKKVVKKICSYEYLLRKT